MKINVLHISHPWGGGIVSYLEDLQNVATGDVQHLIMQCWQETVTIFFPPREKRSPEQYYLGVQLGIGNLTDHHYADLLNLILDRYDITVVQIDSHVGHSFDIFTVPYAKGIPVVLVVHDFFYICPTFHLVDREGQFCGICPAGKENTACLHHHPYLYSPLNAGDLQTLRENFRRQLPMISLLIFPSQAARQIFTTFYPVAEESCRVIPHGSPLMKNVPTFTSKKGALRVGLLGTLLPHKGLGAIEQIIKRLGKKGEIHFYHYGDKTPTGLSIISRGRYNRHEIVGLIQQDEIDIILLLSSWPETFSYTLSEAIAASVPVIATSIGALGERVNDEGTGWILDFNDIDGCCSLLQQLSVDRTELYQRRIKMATCPLKALATMSSEYLELYLSLPQRERAEKTGDEAIPFPRHLSMERTGRRCWVSLRVFAFKVKSKLPLRISGYLRSLFKTGQEI